MEKQSPGLTPGRLFLYLGTDLQSEEGLRWGEGVNSRGSAASTQRPTLFYLRVRNYQTERYGTRYGESGAIQFHGAPSPYIPYYGSRF